MDVPDELTAGQRCNFFCKLHWRGAVIFIVPLILLPMLFFEPVKPLRCAYVILVMAMFWITEAMPLGVTSLLPIICFPVMGILDSQKTCGCYMKDSMFLFLGGLVIASAIEFCNLHKRLAFSVILCIGCSPRRLHFGLMLVTMFVSMWISNTASTAMMCPVIKAVLEELSAQGMVNLTDPTKEVLPDEPPYPSRTVICFYLGVAYAASIGGLGTLIGTGTNLVFKGIYDTRFPTAQDVDFLNFMAFNIPPMIINTILVFFVLHFQFTGMFKRDSPDAPNASPEVVEIARKVVLEKKNEFGSLSCHEFQVGILFLIMVILFVTKSPGVFTGWGDILNAVKIKNSFPVILCVVLLFLLPTNYLFLKYCIGKKPDTEREMPSLLTYSHMTNSLPWGILLLLGGGFAVSESITASGLAKLLGNALCTLNIFPHPIVQLFCILFAVFCTAFTANMAICNILVPIVLEMAVVIKIHPAYLGLPTSLACSMAFHLPVSTPPNAVVAAFANIRTADMAAGGIGPTIITSISLFIFSQTWASIVFPNFKTFPDWAK